MEFWKSFESFWEFQEFLGVSRVFGSFWELRGVLWEFYESFGSFDRASEFKEFPSWFGVKGVMGVFGRFFWVLESFGSSGDLRVLKSFWEFLGVFQEFRGKRTRIFQWFYPLPILPGKLDSNGGKEPVLWNISFDWRTWSEYLQGCFRFFIMINLGDVMRLIRDFDVVMYQEFRGQSK